MAQEFLGGETLHRLAKRHEISRNLIRVRVNRYEAGAFDGDAAAAATIQEREARIAALERLACRQRLELAFLKGHRAPDHCGRACLHSQSSAPRHVPHQGVRADGYRTVHRL